ncbi:transposase for IS2404 domain protein [Mycobacterium ulcerans str. Harvey]|uniref:Transposase for IS2404 domain protein n=1 Tax=Mycobacterium ulcerans str. Harvey TaxID=1299332 RepID=A0ABN0R268_MYCUL|nr:transposase for IS2404 domain protein [Mycobacterium ulcerans str. Harvey]
MGGGVDCPQPLPTTPAATAVSRPAPCKSSPLHEESASPTQNKSSGSLVNA